MLNCTEQQIRCNIQNNRYVELYRTADMLQYTEK